jgi:isopentenyldiphosphate isomerase
MQIVQEVLDVVDENDNVIGCEARSVVHRLGLLHRGIHLFLFDPDGQLLVQRRHRNCDTWPLALDWSVSEHVKSGEDYYSAARRGLTEEFGIISMDLHPIIHFMMSYGESDKMISILYEGKFEPGNLCIDTMEIASVYFLRPSELLLMMDIGDEIFTRWFREFLLWYSGKPSDLGIITQYCNNNRDSYIPLS